MPPLEFTYYLFTKSYANYEVVTKSQCILLFTKFDKLGSSLQTNPLEALFPDYLDGPDIDAAKSYITKKFIALVRHERPICVGYTGIGEDLAATARVASKGIEYFKSHDMDDDHHRKVSYFVMEDGNIIYHYKSSTST